MTDTKRRKLAEAHRQIALAIGVPVLSVEAEQRLTAIARKAAGEAEKE